MPRRKLTAPVQIEGPRCRSHPNKLEGRSGMISYAEALIIATTTVEEKCEISKTAAVRIVLADGRYVVTFEHFNPPHVRGADFDAQVTINAETGEVLQILGGP